MAWQDVAVPLLRYAINDVDTPNRYDNYRLQQAFIIGANYVVNEFTLATNYTVDVPGTGINPDPTGDSTLGTGSDPWTTNLAVLRSAIFMISNDMKLAANSAWAVKDVHMSYDGKELYKANQAILKEAKDAYEQLRMTYQVGVNPNVQAVLTPINILSAGYRMPLYGYEARDRMIY